MQYIERQNIKTVADYPKLCEEWHPTKNRDVTPEQVAADSKITYWWRCNKNPEHEWRATSGFRTTYDLSCPFCTGRFISTTKFSADKSDKITVKLKSSKNVKVTSDRCKKTIRKTLADFPKLAAEWHHTKNGEVTPAEVPAGSYKKFWWKCAKNSDHEWEASVNFRTKYTLGCPLCDRERSSVADSMADNRPKLIIKKKNNKAVEFIRKVKTVADIPNLGKEWHPTKNGSVTPADVPADSWNRYWWKCSKEPAHQWLEACCSRTEYLVGCPLCDDKRVSTVRSLADKFPEIAAEWHSHKNGEVKPSEVSAGSGKKFWWRCREDSTHEWQTSCNARTSGGTGCPFCAKRRRKTITKKENNVADFSKVSASNSSDRKISVNNSFALKFPKQTSQWHTTKNGNLTPENVSAESKEMIWWKCPNGPDYEWRASCSGRIRQNFSCPFCDGTKASVTNSLATKFPGIAAQWHSTKNGELTPKDVVAFTYKKFWWQCDQVPEHEWEAIVVNRVYSGRGCPICAGKNSKSR